MNYGNCFFFACFVAIRCPRSRLVILTSPDCKWIVHFAILTAKGKALWFQHTLPDEQNPHRPWFFLGSVKGASRRRLADALGDRRVLCVCSTWWLALLWIVLVVPFCAGWLGWLWAFNISWAHKALKRRYRK